ncbi:MAG: CpaF family protein [Planctomycetota bacterium]|nr:CpaF family protein [Planctomycetota bacterium]
MKHAEPEIETPLIPPAEQPEFRRIRRLLTERITAHLKLLNLGIAPADPALRPSVEQRLPEEYAGLGITLVDAAREMLFRDVLNEIFGFGPIQPLLDDPSVTEIMVNRADRIYVERKGKPIRTQITFDDDDHVRRMIDRIIMPLGRRLDANSPLVDARLPDGSRVNAVIPPVAIAGSCVTIRKFSKTRLGLDDLVGFGSMPQLIADFLKACVAARLNIVVTGGTGSGKTTLLNALSGCIPADERIVTIEDAAELKLHQDHVITLEAKRPNADGTGEVPIRDLVRNALRMRPERIVVGECRGPEALDMLQAMNTGHDGSLTTLHANSPRDAISRIETMALMAGIDFPVRVIREQIGSAVQLLVHQSRLRDGSRKVTFVTEISGMENDKILLQELFRFKEIPGPVDGPVLGSLLPSGLRPQFMTKLDAIGARIPPETFMPSTYTNAARKSVAA